MQVRIWFSESLADNRLYLLAQADIFKSLFKPYQTRFTSKRWFWSCLDIISQVRPNVQVVHVADAAQHPCREPNPPSPLILSVVTGSRGLTEPTAPSEQTELGFVLKKKDRR